HGPFNSEDNFLMKIDPTGASVVYATYFGGSQSERIYDVIYAGGYRLDGQIVPGGYLNVERAGLAVDASGNAYVGARTGSDDIAPAGTSTSARAGNQDGYVAKINATGTGLIWFTYVGGSSDESVNAVALVSNGLTVTGGTGFAINPPQFPTTSGSFQPAFGGNISDAFVQRLTDPPATPANDNFAQRQAVSGKYITLPADNTGATLESNEPAHA